MLIGGLWHGASWTFVAWGALHGLALCVHKIWMKVTKHDKNYKGTAVGNICSVVITYIFVSFCWIFFRADSWSDACYIIGNIFTNFHADYLPVFVDVRLTWCIFIGVLIVAHSLPTRWWHKLGDTFVRMPWILKLAVFIIVIQLVLQFRGESVSPFIYFQF